MGIYFEATETPNSVGEDLCELCGENFSLKYELKNHTKKAHAKKADDCSECGKINQSLKFLTSHIRTIHTVQRFCTDCSKVFFTKSKLTSHMSNIHADFF